MKLSVKNKQINIDLFHQILLKQKKNENSDKSFSTIDDSLNKINKKSHQKKRVNIHFKTFTKVSNCSNKTLNNIICFSKKNYLIKNLSKQSSTFLILPKRKNGIEYLKTLCNNLKKCKDCKKCANHKISRNIKFNLSKDKKSSKKSKAIKLQKFKRNNQFTSSLFRKPNKGNFVFNSKNKISTNLILVKIK